MIRKYIAGAIQLDTQDNYEENIRTACELIAEGAARGARLLALPETWTYQGKGLQNYAEAMPGGRTFQVLAEQTRKHQIWLHCGSYPEQNADPEDRRTLNTSMLLNPKGEVVVKYTKIHGFRGEVKGMKAIDENKHKKPGEVITVADTDLGRLGMSICYDFRFGEVYRLMAMKGAELFFVPGCVTLLSGKDHWEPILRTRAIENSCYVIAPNQCGAKREGPTVGRSMIIDPWGNVIAKASDHPCVITAEIDRDYRENVRSQFQLLENRRESVYRLEEV